MSQELTLSEQRKILATAMDSKKSIMDLAPALAYTDNDKREQEPR